MANRGTIYASDDIGDLAAYSFNLSDEPSTSAAKNFLSLFNPSGSGAYLLIHSIVVESFALNTTTSVTSMSMFRTTAASGGTQAAASSIQRFATNMANPVGQIRYGNPTVTIDPTITRSFSSWAPPIGGSNRGSSPVVHANTVNKHFVLLPGQGMVFSTSAGDVNDIWRINVIWEEQFI